VDQIWLGAKGTTVWAKEKKRKEKKAKKKKGELARESIPGSASLADRGKSASSADGLLAHAVHKRAGGHKAKRLLQKPIDAIDPVWHEIRFLKPYAFFKSTLRHATIKESRSAAD
jgi:hypothetical protein